MFIDSIFEITYTEKREKQHRFPKILDNVLKVCIYAEFITQHDIDNSTKLYEWIFDFVDSHVTAMVITDYLDGNDIPKNESDYYMDNELKAKIILEEIAKKIILSTPSLTKNKGHSRLI
ncbi:TPA: hypothetical protein ACOJPC_004182 [Vibrio fluvialis]|nr:hypothetical protein [Vibrio parahaemolyticus]